MTDESTDVEEKVLAATLVASLRMQGKYQDCSRGFAKLGRHFGRHMSGKPLLLLYDSEYREDDADFEVCMPIRTAKTVAGIEIKELPGGHCVYLMHQGSYESIGRSYQKIMQHIQDRHLQHALPTREVYAKGPGMIFRGNPQKYRTEIQFLLQK